MNRYRQYGPLDDQPKVQGDAGFTRLDMLTDPALLPPGSLAAAENIRFDAAGTTVRGGVARQFPAGLTVGRILFAGTYRPDSGVTQFALVTASQLFLFRPDIQTVTAYNFPDGETVNLGDPVDLVQAGVGAGSLPTLFLLRGTGQTVLRLDMTGSVTVDTAFAPGNFALFYQDRIAVGQEQQVPVSDFLDFATFNVLNQFQILKGGDDYLRAFLPYQKDYVLIGTEQGWYIAYFDPAVSTEGYTGGLLTNNSFLQLLTSEAGPVGQRAAIQALGQIWFIADSAIYAFAPQLDGGLVVLGKPLSADIQPIMDRFCATYAGGACVERWGYRLYFAMPISDVPIPVTGVTLTPFTTLGLRVPFRLPARLATGSLGQLTSALPHNLQPGDQVFLTGSAAPALNGEFPVLSVTDEFHFSIGVALAPGTVTGNLMTLQKLATRNNMIAVYNLKNEGWESIDVLPLDFHPDWMRVTSYGGRERLWVIDQLSGPALYEQAEADEVGTVSGGVRLPFRLPITLSTANFAEAPIAGRILTRSFRWGAQADQWTGNLTNQFSLKVKQCEVRATLTPTSAGTLTLLVRTPNHTLWTGARDFAASDFETADVPLRKLCGMRGLEAQVQLNTTGGRPTFRSVAIETATVGRVEE